jgi:hypothetical protein
VGSALLAFGSAEIGLSLAGYGFDLALPHDEPRINEPDPVLGWRARPGRYELPAYRAGARRAIVTIWPGGLRATARERRPRPDPVLVLGCSYTQGWAVSDAETYAFKLQRRFPELEILNAGTSAWSTYQSLLRLREHVRDGAAPPAAIVYGFFGEHATRNVADPRWLRLLSRLSQRGHVALPYCRLDDGDALRCAPPTAYAWPALDRHSRLAMLTRQAWDEWARRAVVAQREEVTARLVEAMQREAQRAGATLLVVALHLFEAEREFYLPRFHERGIRVADCAFPDMAEARFTVPGEGHPNGRMHTRWAQCIEPALRAELEAARNARAQRGLAPPAAAPSPSAP